MFNVQFQSIFVCIYRFYQRWTNVIFFHGSFANGLEPSVFFLLNVTLLHVLSFNHSLNPFLPRNFATIRMNISNNVGHCRWISINIASNLVVVCLWLIEFVRSEWMMMELWGCQNVTHGYGNRTIILCNCN